MSSTKTGEDRSSEASPPTLDETLNWLEFAARSAPYTTDFEVAKRIARVKEIVNAQRTNEARSRPYDFGEPASSEDQAYARGWRDAMTHVETIREAQVGMSKELPKSIRDSILSQEYKPGEGANADFVAQRTNEAIACGKGHHLSPTLRCTLATEHDGVCMYSIEAVLAACAPPAPRADNPTPHEWLLARRIIRAAIDMRLKFGDEYEGRFAVLDAALDEWASSYDVIDEDQRPETPKENP